MGKRSRERSREDKDLSKRLKRLEEELMHRSDRRGYDRYPSESTSEKLKYVIGYA